MGKLYFIDKKVGETTSECILRLRSLYPGIGDQKVGHLGTLDPMASGLMIFLVGDDTKKYLEMQKMDKTYSFTIVFGVEMDSWDVLGVAKQYNVLGSTYKGEAGKILSCTQNDKAWDEKDIMEVVETFQGKILQCPPPYSAIRIDGKPLYWWYRNNRQGEIEIKPREREIFSIEMTNFYDFDVELFKDDLEIIRQIDGDFRQREIIEKWQEIFIDFKKSGIKKLPAADMMVRCSSGTYIRSLVHDIGEKLGVPCFAYNIRRTAIGDQNL